ncbi:MAG: hypothetical protein HQP61_10810 [Peptococcaceae bacterium]|nr:hypothetical protein [Candidatus Syntrophopropionicum ammoniitolerans]
MWIGRQVTAVVGDNNKYPDLISIDADSSLVIVELKKVEHPGMLWRNFWNMLRGGIPCM